tara:strand:- start:21051 stop:21479 length:429 start_codon:yes stop_codon:yes gene_type:complete
MKMTLEEYRKLDATGMLWELYPEGVQIIPEKQKRSVRDTMRNWEKPHIEPAKAMNMEEIGEELHAQLKELKTMPTRETYDAPEDPNVATVVKSYLKRAAVGMTKYGVTTERTDIDLIGWLDNLQEELMDATIYLERAKQDLE